MFCNAFVMTISTISMYQNLPILYQNKIGSIGNFPTWCGSELLTILVIFKNDPKSRSVNNSLQHSDLYPYSIENLFSDPKSRSVNNSLQRPDLGPFLSQDVGKLVFGILNKYVFYTINETHKQYSLLDTICLCRVSAYVLEYVYFISKMKPISKLVYQIQYLTISFILDLQENIY